MTDIKTITRANSRPARRGTRRSTVTTIVRPMLNQTVVRTSWSHAALSSGTTGTLSDFIAPSIQNSNEYSTWASIYSEVKMLRARLVLTPLNPYLTTTTTATLTVGTNMGASIATATSPPTLDAVINLSKVRRYSSSDTDIAYYNMPVPRRLQFSAFNQDSPTIPTPWAGSPGVMFFYATGLTNSTAYFRVQVEVTYHLRGRV